MKNKNGITLVSLVITIVIMLILAGVSISFVIGQNGLFTKSKKSAEAYTNAKDKEDDELKNAEKYLDQDEEEDISKVEAGENVSKPNSYASNVKAVSDGKGNKIPVPETCTYETGDKDTGVVIKDSLNNEWVFVPVDNIADYQRRDFTQQQNGATFDTCHEVLNNEDKTSIEKYKGYYIARYESGKDTDNTTLVVQPNKSVYVNVTVQQSKDLAASLKTRSGLNTKLCSSYAWDTAVTYMEKTVPNYGTNSSSYGNYSGHGGQTKNSSPVYNIYDMGGNYWEWTSETQGTDNVVCRGSSYAYVLGAGCRNQTSSTTANGGASFRLMMIL